MSTLRHTLVPVFTLLLTVFFGQVPEAFSQLKTDSVTVRGRIKNLTLQLYRQSPNVTISRNNILQASREMARPAPLEPDGSFRVTVPLVYPYEELYFNFGQVSTAFLASAGTIEIALDADSLFLSEAPFRFSGTNAQVNNQLTRYKAFEFKNRPKIDNRQLSRRLIGRSAEDNRKILTNEFISTYEKYRETNEVLPLLDQYINSVIRYEVSAFLYDKALAEEDTRLESSLPRGILRPADDLFLTIQRTTAMARFAEYAGSRVIQQTPPGSSRGVPIGTFATLVDRYVTDLSATERSRIQELKTARSGQSRDLSMLQRILERHEDTLSRLLTYETTMAQYRKSVDSTGMDYLKAHFLAVNLPNIELNNQKLLYQHISPQVGDRRYQLSLEELYRLEVKDSATVREVAQKFSDKRVNEVVEVLPDVRLLRYDGDGRELFQQLRDQAQGRLIYLLAWSTDVEPSRQEVLAARALQERLGSRDVLFAYVCSNETSVTHWREWVAKNKPKGLHVYVDGDQLGSLIGSLRAEGIPAAGLLGRDGKFIKRNAALPSNPDEVLKLIRERL
ncbi:TlpA family protein disulfide reductase [Larkinella sp. VNQ87]|uniref:TlpA family protein disulfide reductase n=1 Tax=Larkinella sp. VNQ87 TaxID=3400921 RepID=UPI003C01DAE2